VSGKLILVVGQSGAGKDSIIRYAMEKFKTDPQFVFPRRVITRQADIAAEDHDTMDVQEFLALKAQDGFALSWQAHDLHYGVPAQLNSELDAGRHVIVNVSRTILPDMPKLYPNYLIVEITAPPEILEARISARGRSTDGNITKRATRNVSPPPAGPYHFVISNEMSLQEAGEAFCALIEKQTYSAA
jgi:ribose 1,5-bisphosphokinase